MPVTTPTLYGIANSNRKPEDFWGKNQFNASFPVALACYMRDRGIPAQYINIDESLDISLRNIPINEVFNVTQENSNLNFLFEEKYEPYQMYADDNIKNIDLVVCEGGKPVRPLEIKLTALPDEASHQLSPEKWGCELVIRPASTSYAALGIIHSIWADIDKARDIIEPVGHKIRAWNNRHEISTYFEDIVKMLNTFCGVFYKQQKPFLMQTIWKTKGKSPFLDDNAFDIFIWSDFALCKLFMKCAGDKIGVKINRYERSVVRFARFLYEVTTRKKVNINSIYTEMSFDLQTDKEFAANGRVTSLYLKSNRLSSPIITKDELFQIILCGGEQKLSPERRLDQSVYLQALLEGKIL